MKYNLLNIGLELIITGMLFDFFSQRLYFFNFVNLNLVNTGSLAKIDYFEIR